VKAVRDLNLLYGSRVTLKVVGHYENVHKQNLLKLAGHEEGRGFLEFCRAISDEQLVSLYASAAATIVPSHVEGFSLPVVEASVCGCPVIASTCAAHMELVEQPEALFPSDNAAQLLERLEAVLQKPSIRASLVKSQVHLGPRFHEDNVGQRFWNALEAGLKSRRTAAVTGQFKKPRLAFLSPYSSDQPGVARYTGMTMRANEALFDADLYTDAPRPLPFEGSFRDAGKVSLAPLVHGKYNGVISVLGNSPFHASIFDIFERYGGPCILHDANRVQIYIHRFGPQRFLQLAVKLIGRQVSMDEVHAWAKNRYSPSLLLEPIIERASPLIVHTATQQTEIKNRYGVDAHVAPCCPTFFFRDEELTPAAKHAVRERYGISPAAFWVSSFGTATPERGMATAILAVEILRSWNIPAQLHFAGNATPYKDEINRIAALYGIGEYVRAGQHFVDDAQYRDFLIGSDAAIQLRPYGFGQLSTALTDCISAGLPCVASSDLAHSCDAPDYVLTVPDQFSPLLAAEQLAVIWESRLSHSSNSDGRATYMETHNFRHYGKRLIEILGVA
jgi:glycosyltransferase involved in cell wall biosynthesis